MTRSAYISKARGAKDFESHHEPDETQEVAHLNLQVLQLDGPEKVPPMNPKKRS